ncbi:MAG TPA: protein kinase [Candidatus Obscuribacterales bacterium]
MPADDREREKTGLCGDNGELSDESSPQGSFISLLARHAALPEGYIIGDRYKVLSLIGHGGMGTVYKVEQIFLKKQFALKILTTVQLPEIAIRRFQKEARAASKLDHRNLVKAHEFGLIENQLPYFVMDLVEGKTLTQYLKQIGTISVEDALRLFPPICFGLAFAHQQGVVHRDLKPSNIILTKTDSVTSEYTAKVVDFGIAKMIEGEGGEALTRTGEVFGTPLYMSPEQCTGMKVDHRSDIYSFGCVMFEALTGAPPFAGETALATMMRHQSEQPQSLKEASLGREYPETLEKIVRRCLEKNPDARYQSFLELANDLMMLQREPETIQIDAQQVALAVAERRTNIAFMIVGAIGFLLLGATAGYFVGKGSQPAPAVLPPVESITTKPDTYNFERSYFSTKEGDGAGRRRQFVFPLDVARKSIFRVGSEPSDPDKAVDAVGRRELDIPVCLFLDSLFCQSHLRELNRFRQDEVRAVTIIYRVKDYLEAVEQADISRVSDETLAFVRNFDRLTYLNVQDSKTSDVGLSYLIDHSPLKVLMVSNTRVTGKGLAKLNFEKMIHFRADAIPEINLVLPKLAKAPLSVLSLEDTDLDDSSAQHISRIASLDNLNIRNNPKITEHGIAYLSKLPRLTAINIDLIPITPGICEALARMKQLTHISVEGTGLDDAGLERISQKQSLVDIHLGHNPKVTDRGLSHLTKLKNLTRLHLTSTPRGSGSRPTLEKMTQLRTLILCSDGWTMDEQNALKAALPKCDVQFGKPEGKEHGGRFGKFAKELKKILRHWE